MPSQRNGRAVELSGAGVCRTLWLLHSSKLPPLPIPEKLVNVRQHPQNSATSVLNTQAFEVGVHPELQPATSEAFPLASRSAIPCKDLPKPVFSRPQVALLASPPFPIPTAADVHVPADDHPTGSTFLGTTDCSAAMMRMLQRLHNAAQHVTDTSASGQLPDQVYCAFTSMTTTSARSARAGGRATSTRQMRSRSASAASSFQAMVAATVAKPKALQATRSCVNPDWPYTSMQQMLQQPDAESKIEPAAASPKRFEAAKRTAMPPPAAEGASAASDPGRRRTLGNAVELATHVHDAREACEKELARSWKKADSTSLKREDVAVPKLLLEAALENPDSLGAQNLSSEAGGSFHCTGGALRGHRRRSVRDQHSCVLADTSRQMSPSRAVLEHLWRRSTHSQDSVLPGEDASLAGGPCLQQPRALVPHARSSSGLRMGSAGGNSLWQSPEKATSGDTVPTGFRYVCNQPSQLCLCH